MIIRQTYAIPFAKMVVLTETAPLPKLAHVKTVLKLIHKTNISVIQYATPLAKMQNVHNPISALVPRVMNPTIRTPTYANQFVAFHASTAHV